MATPITTTILNVIFNPYTEKRPKNPEKIYDMNDMFDKLSKRSFPIVLSNISNKYIDNITINSVYACLPGGRGCVGKERMGTKLLDRQIAMVHDKGFLKNPSHKNKSIGFLQMLGVIVYKDGRIGNVSIPVETSGVVGLRAGGVMINPQHANKNKLDTTITEIETHILELIKIKKKAKYRIVMINGTYNLYTDLQKQDRPRVSNFMTFLKLLHRNGLNEHYKKPATPWQNRQGAPSVVKAVFRSDTLPTFMITPFGHCEVMGAKSFDDIITIYKLSLAAFNNIESEVNFNQPVNKVDSKKKYKLNKNGKLVPMRESRKYTKREKINVSIMNNNIEYVNRLLFKKKPCNSYPKHVIKNMAERKGVLTKGTKKELCDRISSLF